MKYYSTRSEKINGKSAAAAIKQGLAEDGGLFMPDEIPALLDPELPQQLLVSAFRRYRR